MSEIINKKRCFIIKCKKCNKMHKINTSYKMEGNRITCNCDLTTPYQINKNGIEIGGNSMGKTYRISYDDF